MDEDAQNLIDFNSPILQTSTISKINKSTSPGNNPFDSLFNCTKKLSDFEALSPNKLFKRNLTVFEDRFTIPDDSFTSGKESLGILKAEALNNSFDLSQDLSHFSLNTGFLYPSNHRLPSNISPISPNPTLFNSGSIEGSQPSKIYSVYSNNNSKCYESNYKYEEVFNDAFLCNTNSTPLDSVSLNIEICGKENLLNHHKIRLFSIPELKRNEEISLPLNDEQIKDDESFSDFVFIECRNLAARMADTSICQENSLLEIDLDSTEPPDFKILDEFETDLEKVGTAEVFKAIDNLLPPSQDCLDQSITKEVNNEIINNDVKTGNILNNKSNDLCGSRESSNGSSKIKDANEILHGLSEMINTEVRDSKQKMEGQQLLTSLANILCPDNNSSTNNIDSFEDSGHSSIEQDCSEVLDLRVTTSGCKSNDNGSVLDLSMKSQRLTKSFSVPTAGTLLNNAKTSSSLKSLEYRAVDKMESNKLKPKKIEKISGLVKKGPLKAVIPVGVMAKTKSLVKAQNENLTPPRTSQIGCGALFRIKKTSTPIQEPKLIPLAQSTPDILVERNRPLSCSSELNKYKFPCPISPLVRPSSILNASVSEKGSISNTSNRSGSLIPSPKSMHRRHSATDLKAPQSNFGKLKRSYSTGKDLKTSNVIAKAKNNVAAAISTIAKGKNNAMKTCAVRKYVLEEKRSTLVSSNVKLSNLPSKIKQKLGKENVKKIM